MSELLPCPFCGSKYVISGKYDHDYGHTDWVECEECEASMRGENEMDGMVINKWNRRALPPDVTEYKGEGIKPNASFTLKGGNWEKDKVG